jgi:hypothetical protein
VVTVGTTLSVGQTFTILIKNSAGAITGYLRKGVLWWAATVPFSRSVTPEAMATTSCSRRSRRRSPNRAHGSAVCLRSLGSLSLSVADCGWCQFSDICSDECEPHRTPPRQIVYPMRWSQPLAGAMTSSQTHLYEARLRSALQPLT